MESRQDWGRARVNVGVVAEARRELKLSGNKTGLNYHPRSPVSDMPRQAHAFWASSMHGHFFSMKPTMLNISFWLEALPACPPTNSYCFSRCSRWTFCIEMGACAVFAASQNLPVKGWSSQLIPPPLWTLLQFIPYEYLRTIYQGIEADIFFKKLIFPKRL